MRAGTSSPSDRIILFTRYPEAGKTKTRLVPALGPQGAADLHRELTEHALREARPHPSATIEVVWTGGNAADMRAWLGPEVKLREQGTGDLGARMGEALTAAFNEGVTHALIAGCDCPDLDAATYEAAFEALRSCDVVLGPATDGGYYLIGLRADAKHGIPALLDGMTWSTSDVFQETLTRAERAGLRVATLAPLADVDLPEDLPVWERTNHPRPALSVIVCALNDGTRLDTTLDAFGDFQNTEIIVADGGSTDHTRAIAHERGAVVVEAPRGRAYQFNLGAARASGESFLFLHADTHVPSTFREDIRTVLEKPGAVAGAFRFATDYDSASMRIVSGSANLRACIFQLPYGDQGLFLRRRTFHRAAGFPPVPLMEDYMLVRRLQQLGRIMIAESVAVTSGDRWRRLGVWRTTLRNARIVAQYELLGTTPERLAHLYRRGRE